MQSVIGFVAFAVLLLVGFAGLQAGGFFAQAIILLLSALVGFGVTRSQESAKYQRELEAKLLTDKKVLYKSYLDMVRSYMAKGEKTPTTAEILPKMHAFVFNSMLNASDDVIRAHNAFSRLAQKDSKLVLPAMGDVILAMRRDAGRPETTLRSDEILRPLINDLDENMDIFREWDKERAPTPGKPAAKLRRG